MMKVIIHSMERRCVVSDQEYDWVQRRLGEELQVGTFSWGRDGSPFSVYFPDGPVVFLYDGGVEYGYYLS